MKLSLDIRQDDQGRPYLHFPFMSLSDIHWGTGQSRAKRLCQLLEHTRTDHTQLAGDIIDLEYMTEKLTWNLGPWHRQGMGHILRRAGDESSVVKYNRGNHEDNIRGDIFDRLNGRHLYGVQFEDQSEYVDPGGLRVLIDHGHRFDKGAIKLLQRPGMLMLNGLYRVDRANRRLFPNTDFSFAANGKHVVKKTINNALSVNKAMRSSLDASDYDAYIYGHTHMGGFEQTPGGKIIMNDGTSTEHVQTLVHDAEGNWALIKWHRHCMWVTEPDGNVEKLNWADLGLEHFSEDPMPVEDEYTACADRISRVVARIWPAKDRQDALEAKQKALKFLRENQEPDIDINLIFAANAALNDPALDIPVPRPRTQIPAEPKSEPVKSEPVLV